MSINASGGDHIRISPNFDGSEELLPFEVELFYSIHEDLEEGD